MKIVRSLKKRKLSIQNIFFKFMLLSNMNYVNSNNKKIRLNWEKHRRKINTILSDLKVSSESFSQVSFTLNRNIPKLAWCLKIAESSININYGTGVTSHSKGIVEGVWGGDFNNFDYSKSEHVFGSGLTVENKKLIITPPSHMYECIFLIKNKLTNEIIASNSLAYCLSFFKNDIKNDDEIFEDIRKKNDQQTKLGVFGFEPLMYEHDSFNIFALYYHNFSISPTGVELESRLYERNYLNFESYKIFLEDTLRSLIENGENKNRVKHLKVFSTLSNGYDSPAVTCLLQNIADIDCATINVEVHGVNDSGLEIAKKLGITCESCEHPIGESIRDLGDVKYSKRLIELSSDFFATQGLGDDSVFLSFEKYLDDKIVFTGALGDTIWGATNQPPNGIPVRVLYGKSLTEYRLKKGFAHVPVPVIGATFPISIYRLNYLSDMKPYSIKGNYNRPIARRIIEEAGVPRGMFATSKNATNPHITNSQNFKKHAFYKVFNDYDFK
jgi:hypothetical protein